jgi:hypothetical protein
MGAHPYWYYVPYQADVEKALQELRDQEYQAGRYNPVIPFPDFPLGPDSPTPGPAHETYAEIFEDADADGTRSILDIQCTGDAPDFGTAGPLPDEMLEDLYDTRQPTRAMVENNMDFLEDVERGHCVYIILYKDGQPDEIFFAGYSFD